MTAKTQTATRPIKHNISVSPYAILITILLLAALVLAFVDPRGLLGGFLIVVVAAFLRLHHTTRTEVRKTNELLQRLLDKENS